MGSVKSKTVKWNQKNKHDGRIEGQCSKSYIEIRIWFICILPENRADCVIISVLDSSVMDRRFESRWGIFGICCFSAKQVPRSVGKYWIVSFSYYFQVYMFIRWSESDIYGHKMPLSVLNSHEKIHILLNISIWGHTVKQNIFSSLLSLF